MVNLSWTNIEGPFAEELHDLSEYEELYKHFHANPEHSRCEAETAKTIASHFSSRLPQFKLHTSIGGHGIAAVLENRPEDGPTVLLRADMDALPVRETTGLPYASTKVLPDEHGNAKPVMHACGHDMHIACLLGAARTLSRLSEKKRGAWTGTLILVFQPDEERGRGSQAMLDDGLYSRSPTTGKGPIIPAPDVVLGQHVMRLRAGAVGVRPGPIMAAADTLKVTLHGKGGHDSMPHRAIDPAVLAASTVMRLQTLVSREADPGELAVLTVGTVRVGETENVIGDTAELGVDTRTVEPAVREKLLRGVRRVVEGECAISASPHPPDFVETRKFPVTVNDAVATARLSGAFEKHFASRDRFEKASGRRPEKTFDPDIPLVYASEDFSLLATGCGAPSVFWFFGGIDQELWDRKRKEGRLDADVPSNHNSGFAPVIQPTLRTGIEALVVAALTFLGPGHG